MPSLFSNKDLKMLNFPNSLVINGAEWNDKPFKFDVNCINCKVTPTWQDVILSGTGSLTVINALADGLNYVKLFGKCVKDYTPTTMEYSAVYAMAHTTFDVSKFIVTGSPTITTDGIASGFSTSKYINFFNYNQLLNHSWEIRGSLTKKTTDTSVTGNCFLFPFKYYVSQGGLQSWKLSNKLVFIGIFGADDDKTAENQGTYVSLADFAEGQLVYYSLAFNYQTGVYTLSVWGNSVAKISSTYIPPTTNKQMNLIINSTSDSLLRLGSGSDSFQDTPVDLKDILIRIEDEPVFSGCQTGTDNYTISGNSVSIPYTLSNTGLKIADNAYLSRVQSVSENLEITPYLVIDENNKTAKDYRAKIICNNGALKINNLSQIITDGTVETIKDSLNNTATAQPLFAVGTVKDVHEILTGTVTRNCEALYYDGTQTVNTPYISTTGGLDVGAIIIHPKSLSTTETVTAQTLTTTAGNNIIEITQASIDNLGLEVSYKATI